MLQDVRSGSMVAVTCFDKARLNCLSLLNLQISRQIHFTESITELWTIPRHQKKQPI